MLVLFRAQEPNSAGDVLLCPPSILLLDSSPRLLDGSPRGSIVSHHCERLHRHITALKLLSAPFTEGSGIREAISDGV